MLKNLTLNTLKTFSQETFLRKPFKWRNRFFLYFHMTYVLISTIYRWNNLYFNYNLKIWFQEVVLNTYIEPIYYRKKWCTFIFILSFNWKLNMIFDDDLDFCKNRIQWTTQIDCLVDGVSSNLKSLSGSQQR